MKNRKSAAKEFWALVGIIAIIYTCTMAMLRGIVAEQQARAGVVTTAAKSRTGTSHP